MARADYAVSLERPAYPRLPVRTGFPEGQYQLNIYDRTATCDELFILHNYTKYALGAHPNTLVQEVDEGGAVLTADSPIEPYFYYLGLQARKETTEWGTQITLNNPLLSQLAARARALPLPVNEQLVLPQRFRGKRCSFQQFFYTIFKQNAVPITDNGEKSDVFARFVAWSMTPKEAISQLRNQPPSIGLMIQVDYTVASKPLGVAVVNAFQNEATANRDANGPGDVREYWEPVAKIWSHLLPGDNMETAMAQRRHCLAIGEAATSYMAVTSPNQIPAAH